MRQAAPAEKITAPRITRSERVFRESDGKRFLASGGIVYQKREGPEVGPSSGWLARSISASDSRGYVSSGSLRGNLFSGPKLRWRFDRWLTDTFCRRRRWW